MGALPSPFHDCDYCRKRNALIPEAERISWAFELTPEGLNRTEFADGLPKTSSRNRVWLYVVVVVGAISVSLFFLGRYSAPRNVSESANIPAKSIAVLPFENFSEDKPFVFFADGVQDEILSDLAKIADLKVISRTSVMQYKNTATRNLPEIAQALKVAHVLEGKLHYRPGVLRGRRHSDVMLQRCREALTSCTKQSHAQHDGNAAVGQKNIAG